MSSVESMLPRRGELDRSRHFTVEAETRLLGFSHIELAGEDKRGGLLVDVFWPDGSAIRDIDSETPAFSLHTTHTKESIVLTLERAAHIQELHFAHIEAGSHFSPRVNDDYSLTPTTLAGVVHQVAKRLNPISLQGEWTQRSVELPTDGLPAREGIASLDELLHDGVISEPARRTFRVWEERIKAANCAPGLRQKLKLVAEFNEDIQSAGLNGVALKVLREKEGGVVVPFVATAPRTTSRMMVEFSSPHHEQKKYIHTITPGRKMPRHPIPRLYASGSGIDSRAFHNALWMWSQHAHLVVPNDEAPYLLRTIDHMRSPQVRDRSIKVRTDGERRELEKIEREAYEIAMKTAKSEIKEIAAFLGLATTVEVAQRLKREWMDVINDFRKRVFPFTEGRTLEEYLRSYHENVVFSSPEHILLIESQKARLRRAEEEQATLYDGVLDELEERADEPELQVALGAWTSSPDSNSERSYDGMGYNAGLLHFFEYRGAKHKRKRFLYIQEPETVDGFILFTKRMVAALEESAQPNSESQLAIIEDEDGNRRYYVLLPGPTGEFIVAFQNRGDVRPKLAAMFPEVTQQAFERMTQAVLDGEDRGQIKRLHGAVKPVIMKIKQ